MAVLVIGYVIVWSTEAADLEDVRADKRKIWYKISICVGQ